MGVDKKMAIDTPTKDASKNPADAPAASADSTTTTSGSGSGATQTEITNANIMNANDGNTTTNSNTNNTKPPTTPKKPAHLAGFADPVPIPSPASKSAVPSFWAVGGGAGSTSATTLTTATPQNTPAKAVNNTMDSEPAEKNGEIDTIAITPAAGAVMDAIPAAAIATATLTDEKEGEETGDTLAEILGADAMEFDEELTNMADPVEKAAREAATTLNKEALYSTYESNYAILQKERDDLRRQLSKKDDDATRQSQEHEQLKVEMETLKKEVMQTNSQKDALRGVCVAETNAKEDVQQKLECANERVDRVEKEADNLRAELSRLTKSNEEYNALLTTMSTQHSKSSSEAIPLRLQVKRLEQELEATMGHSTYLEGELSDKNQVISQMKQTHSSELRSLRGELTTAQFALEQSERELSAARTNHSQTGKEIEKLQKKLYDKEVEFAERAELLERDVNQERELVSLKEQRMIIAEDQKESLAREVEELRSLAKEAAEEATRNEIQLQTRLREEVDAGVREVRESEQHKREELEELLLEAREAKSKLEEDVLNAPSPARRRRIDGEAPLAITDGGEGSSLMLLDDESNGPLSLTDLYARLAETEDQLRNSRNSNRKLKILIERIHRDVAAKTPLFHQKQLELEGALEELDICQERLEHAQMELTGVRADNGDLEVRFKRAQKECEDYQRENVDLARQVQSLLQRRCDESGDGVTFVDIAGLQEQNQRLLSDHHSMSAKIDELETRIKENPEAVELGELRTEVVSLREEREKQSKLVVGIVHQRDLYRALVAKNDAPLLQDGGGGENRQLVLADAKAQQLPLIEAKNVELAEEVSKLTAEYSVTKHENEALQGRVVRLDAHSKELTTSSERLRGELTTAKSTCARLEIDVGHYQSKCTRLESSLESFKSENVSEKRRREQVEEMLNKTQGHLEAARGELGRKEAQYQQASSKMRLLEVQLTTSTSNEKRLESDASSLRSEIARQETLLSSVQRIEASLTAKSEGELEGLNDELKVLKESKEDDVRTHGEAVQKLEGKIADLEMTVKQLGEQKEEATVKAAEANAQAVTQEATAEALSSKLKSTEKELNAAKIKLGDVTIDTSAEEALEASVASLTAELETTKTELETAQKRNDDYQAIAKYAEQQVTELTEASTKYKTETTAQLEKLRESEQLQCEAVAELTKDLMSHRSEKETAVNELTAKVDSLSSQLTGAKEDAATAVARVESLTDEAKRHQLDAKNANENYERELALHAEARTALRDAREGVESALRLRAGAEANLASVKTEVEGERTAWEERKEKLEASLSDANGRVEDVRKQNNLLQDQMTSLGATVEKFQNDKASQLVGGEASTAAEGKPDAGSSDDNKQMSDMRELLRFKQSECTMLEADLASAKRASERERAAAEMAKRSLEESRSELKVLREGDSTGGAGGAAGEEELVELRTKLASAEEQLMLLRESNAMLREESQKVAKKLSEVESQLNALKTSTAPQTQQMRGMEVQQASLAAEKESLEREVEAWKGRVHSLVSKFNQIDPEEHAQALASVGKLKRECTALRGQKAQSDASAASAKTLVAKQNKELSSQKSSIEAFKAALEKTKKEKDELARSGLAKSNKLTSKKVAEAQEATKKAEAAKTTAKTEAEALKSRMANLQKIMQKMKAGLRDAKKFEGEAKATEEGLREEIAGLKGQVQVVQSSGSSGNNNNVSASAGAVGAVKAVAPAAAGSEASSAKTVAPSAAKESEDEVAAPMEEADEKKEAAAKEVPPAAAASPLPETKVEPPAKKSAGDAAVANNKAETQTKKVATTAKGKKRKATAPKRNAAPDSAAAEGAKAPPQKKAAVAAKKGLPVAAAESKSATPAEGGAKTPPQKKAVVQPKAAAKVFTPPNVAAKSPLDPTTEGYVPPHKRAAAAAKKEAAPIAATAATDSKAESARALISLATQATTTTIKQATNTTTTTTASTKKVPAAKKAAASKEEAMKLKMEEMKKRRNALLAKKQEAEKKLAAKKKMEANAAASAESSSASANEGSDSETRASVAVVASTPKKTLPSVPERGEAVADAKEATPAASKDTPAKPTTFGSLAVPGSTPPVMTFGARKSEPDCPKPSFFGASAAGTKPSSSFFGASAANAGKSMLAFGGAAASKTPTQPQAGGLKSSGSGAFLDLVPPGTNSAAATPGKFVFGKSANITLAVPTGGSPLTAATGKVGGFGASFGRSAAKFGSGAPFGGGGGFGAGGPFGGASPFGGGGAAAAAAGNTESKKRSLGDAGGEEPDAKQSRAAGEEEEGEIADADAAETKKSGKDEAAKEA